MLSPVLHGHGCGCRNPTRVRVSDSANPKKQDSEIRLISFLFLNFTNKYAGTGLKVRQKAQKAQPTIPSHLYLHRPSPYPPHPSTLSTASSLPSPPPASSLVSTAARLLPSISAAASFLPAAVSNTVDGRRGGDGSSVRGAARQQAGVRRAAVSACAGAATGSRRLRLGGRRANGERSCRAPGGRRVDGGRADDERSCPDTAAACLVRVASRPTRIDARIRVDAPKKFWTRVSR